MILHDQKYESPIEEMLAASMARNLPDHVECWTQHALKAGDKSYRADFLLKANDRLTVVEADGREFHEFWKDQDRDVRMLDQTDISDVIRLRGCDVFFDSQSCAEVLMTLAPHLRQSDSKPMDGGDVLLAGASARGWHVKPIARVKVDVASAQRYGRSIEDSECASLLGVTSDRRAVVAQIKSAHWDRKYHGPKVWQIADYLRIKGMTFDQFMNDAG